MSLDPTSARRPMRSYVSRTRWWWSALLAVSILGAGLTAFDAWHVAKAAQAPSINPLLSLVRVREDSAVLVGRVEQRLSAGSYSYHALRLERDGSTQWAVTLGKGAPVGTRVRVRSFGRRTEFHSPRLKRTFPELVFGIVSRVD